MEENTQNTEEIIKVYKISEPVKSEIKDYLNTRPWVEVDTLIKELYEKENDPDPYINKEGLVVLTNYLTTCPRIEVKDIIKKLQNSIIQYTVEPKSIK
jgi:hypothetical protein